VADERTLAFLAELERADAEVAATLAELEALAGRVEAERARALELEVFFERLPAERERLAAELAEAARRAEAARAELARAEEQLAAAERRGDEAAVASNAVVRARDALRMATRRATEAAATSSSLEAQEGDAKRESAALVDRVAGLAEELRERPRLAQTAGSPPDRDLASVGRWAGSARAALFVAIGSLTAERDALVRQASELGSLVLGESVFAGTAAEVARRVRSAE
jgi:chromosome segregation ATPase